MSTTELAVELPVSGPAAPPRSNGELVFAEPWESRAFGIALSLHEADVFPWEDFQAALITAVAEAEATGTDTPYSYYACWLQALEMVLFDRGLVIPQQLEERIAEQRARPAGHDHGDHSHDHTHG